MLQAEMVSGGRAESFSGLFAWSVEAGRLGRNRAGGPGSSGRGPIGPGAMMEPGLPQDVCSGIAVPGRGGGVPRPQVPRRPEADSPRSG